MKVQVTSTSEIGLTEKPFLPFGFPNSRIPFHLKFRFEMFLHQRLQTAIQALLLTSGTLCFGWEFGVIWSLIWLAFRWLAASIPTNRVWKGFSERLSRSALTLFCFGYLPFLAFWGNFTQFTGFSRLSSEEAFWLFNSYTFFLEIFLIFSQKTDQIRSFLILIALEQVISGMVFRPTAFSALLLLPALAFLLLALHLRTEFRQTRKSLQVEMKNACDEMICHFATSLPLAPAIPTASSNSPNAFHPASEISLSRIPVSLGAEGESEIRAQLRSYPLSITRRRQALCFVSQIESLERLPVWEPALPETASVNRPTFELPEISTRNFEQPRHLRRFPIGFWLTASLLFGLFFFVTIYRPEHFRGGNFGWILPAAVGYSETSRLGEFGPQLKNPAPFLWLRLFRDDGQHQWNVPVTGKNWNFSASRPDFASEPLYLRGAVFDHYENAAWNCSPTMEGVNPTCLRAEGIRKDQLYLRPDVWNRRGLIRMEETFEPTLEPTFFACWPCYLPPDEMDSPQEFSPEREKILFTENEPRPGVPYSLLTQGFTIQPAPNPKTNSEIRISQSPWTPCQVPVENPELIEPPDPVRFSSLCALAEKWHAEILADQSLSAANSSAAPVPDHAALASGFARRLAHSPRFHYSTAPVRREKALDPLEDFIRNHPQGHCEFYAAALVLMLRSQGIPARYVVGFAPQEFSSASQAWIVRHQDAHAWAEVWVPFQEIPSETIAQSGIPISLWQSGAWLRMDPTSQQVLEARKAAVTPFFRLTDGWETLWKNYVLNLNFSTQRDCVYQPLRACAQRFLQNWQAFRPLAWFPGIAVGLLGLGWLIRFFRKTRFGRFFPSRADSKKSRTNSVTRRAFPSAEPENALESLLRRRQHSVLFFRQIEQDLAAQGLKRKTGESSLEFMASAENELGRSGLREAAGRYYQIRFGRKK